MLAIIRIFIISIFLIIICILGFIYCLFKPKDPNHVSTMSYWFQKISIILGIQVEIRYPKNVILPKNCVYIANHQNNYDIIAVSYAIQPRTITLGKQNLFWIPFFGLLYWITGNILINRKHYTRMHSILIQIIKYIKQKDISIWIFPEGTRSYNYNLLPFKFGAFYIAILSHIPIVPVCISNLHNKIKLNRWSNGWIIIEILSPIQTTTYNHKQVPQLTQYCYHIMENKLHELNTEILYRESLQN